MPVCGAALRRVLESVVEILRAAEGDRPEWAGFCWNVETFWMLVVVDGQNAIFDCYARAREGNDALNDVLINNASLWIAAHRARVGATICEHDYFAAFRNVFFFVEVCHCHSKAINNHAVAVMEGIFHTTTDHVVALENKTIQNKSTKCNCANKQQKTNDVIQGRVFLRKTWLGFFHTSILA